MYNRTNYTVQSPICKTLFQRFHFNYKSSQGICYVFCLIYSSIYFGKTERKSDFHVSKLKTVEWYTEVHIATIQSRADTG